MLGRRCLIAVAVAALTLVGCGGSSSGSSSIPPLLPGEVAVTAKNIAFSPEHVTIKQGQTVVFQFRDTVAHNATFDDFKSKDITKGVYKHRFDQTGKFSFKCTIHPTMTGDVTVQ